MNGEVGSLRQRRRRRRRKAHGDAGGESTTEAWQTSREYFNPKLLTSLWARNHQMSASPPRTTDEEAGGGHSGGGSGRGEGDAQPLGGGELKLGWRDIAALGETQLPGFLECTWLLVIRSVIEHMRFDVEFCYELLLELFTGIVVGSLYSNFMFHDLQQVGTEMLPFFLDEWFD